MSLLERLGRTHLDDATFARLWAEGFDGLAPSHPHLEACAACRERFAQFGRWVEGVAATMHDEADELLTPDRLAVQHAQIARRLEALDRPARVIAFPKAARAVISGHSHVRRWVTVAAAASLIITGFGLGQMMPLRQINSAVTNTRPQLTEARTQSRAIELTPVAPAHPEDELLSDVLAQPRVSTLSALDEMTPHARDMK